MTECDMKDDNCGLECTGYDGAQDWKEIRKIVEDIPCERCSDSGVKKIDFVHDIVNLGLGRKAFDKENFHKELARANCVSEKCLSEGRC